MPSDFRYRLSDFPYPLSNATIAPDRKKSVINGIASQFRDENVTADGNVITQVDAPGCCKRAALEG